MKPITDIETLEALYGTPVPTAVSKVANHLTPLYQQWIGLSQFVIISTIGPEGTDGSPRGDDGPVVTILDPNTLLLPDWRGNNRIDSLRNIVYDNRVSLMFMVAGCNNVVRVNGSAIITADQEVLARFGKNGKHPKTVISVRVGEVYFQCAKALMRSGLWIKSEQNQALPSAGQFIKEMDRAFDADAYDTAYPDRARKTIW